MRTRAARLGLTSAAVIAFALSVGVAPAAAYFGVCTGTCGYFVPGDENPPISVVCKYERGGRSDLDWIKVTPPVVYGTYQSDTPVKWRFKVQRQPMPGDNYVTVYTSSWQTSMANANDPAYLGYGFSRRTWTAPENPTGRYQVRLDIQWKHNGSVEGSAVGVYYWYMYKWYGGGGPVSEGCSANRD